MKTDATLEEYLDKLQAIYVIEQGGILKHSEFFQEQNINPDLVSGLLSALNIFAEQLGQGELESIELEQQKFAFEKIRNYIIALQVDASLSDDIAKDLLSQLVKRLDLVETLGIEGEKLTLVTEKGRITNFSIMAEIKKHIEESKKGSVIEEEIFLNDLSPQVLPPGKYITVRKLLKNTLRIQTRISAILLAAPWEGDMQLIIADRLIEDSRNKLLSHILELITTQDDDALTADQEFSLSNYYCFKYALLSSVGGFVLVVVEMNSYYQQLKPFLLRLVGTIEQLIYS